MAPDSYRRLVHVRRWSRARYTDWYVETMTAQLLA